MKYYILSIFGSCRVNDLQNTNNINNILTYCHNTKEMIQLIKYMNGTIKLNPPYNKICFRSGILYNLYINYKQYFKYCVKFTNIFILEICSRKKYIYDNYYLNYLVTDKRYPKYHNLLPLNIKKNYKFEIQSDKEIKEDILIIQKLVSPAKILIISHYNSKINNKYIPARNSLIQLLTLICRKYNIHFINPTNVLSKYPQKNVIKHDLAHYTNLGGQILYSYIYNYIRNKM